MNIKRAKEEIKNSIQAYLSKDEYGMYKIPIMKQRPILLIGPPGIGKTAIMEQIAMECKIGLLAYTITHHTRQSAVGLPFISKKVYSGREYAVTEYTMSEIIAAVYNKIEETGLREGILFLDEINCVSETLAPTMLQFLQFKTFGNHKLPEGWIIVAAGNPPEYNKSVRDFDIVTLDRLKKIEVEDNFDVWKEYAYKQGIHGAVLSYLEIKKDHFYKIETTIDGMSFVTARGWEDLSKLLLVYEELNLKVDEQVVIQYLQNQKIAKDFSSYLELYVKYEKDYQIQSILNGQIESELVKRVKEAQFDERYTVIGLLLAGINENFQRALHMDAYVTGLYEVLQEIKENVQENSNVDGVPELLMSIIQRKNIVLTAQKEAGQIEIDQVQAILHMIQTLEEYKDKLVQKGSMADEESFQLLKEWFYEETKERNESIEKASNRLKHAFLFMEKAFGESQEMVIFITELAGNYHSMRYISEFGCDKYYEYNKGLLFQDRKESIIRDIQEVNKLMES
ncbi:ATP-binding protein [Anaeromicropila populeti]|uniref:ATPase family associated with various cellular activities (AAA) n=1 Tax=Anaeromicropila populeti TaxID=37658 RepID=A0A1I6IQZ7_9FIRM|nr:AAA family ATPase [Anaeromicropila populeti]SFR69185.1 ATPase family associated with various cellular activities (AAA) [Anaeromicropila populeti]